MPRDYVGRIEELGHEGLLRLWEAIRQQAPLPEWAPGKALEFLVLRAFQEEGAEIVWPFEVQLGSDTIEQIDGALY